MTGFGVLILGGYGNFGARIARLLAANPSPRLVISGRDGTKAETLANRLRGEFPGLQVEGICLDLNDKNLTARIADLGCDVAIHTAGPFQGQDFGVAGACIDAGVHYIDLADGRAFVNGFEILNDRAVKAEVLAVSGASSFPGLSMAVVDKLASALPILEDVDIALAIAGKYPPGLATTQAILAYCGKPIPVWKHSEWSMETGWLDLTWRRIPGLGWRLLGLCDVPDLELLPKLFPQIKDSVFRVALESRLAQFGFAVMATLGKWGWVGDWRPLAPLIDRLAYWIRHLGTDVSAMTISVAGGGVRRSYNLKAGSGHGPMIPCLPSVVLVRKLIRGELRLRGAMPCRGLYTLEELESAFDGLDISRTIA
ncbi:MAG: saccharopine dehydrogenase NADP-binding domain-containing protein [Alphaproteobacteria bacterium]|nr:saccharopine dehydrogenase NADP-binding domain-containing protein [Alphaproteobacteria bacterium]